MLVCLYALRGFTRPSYISGGGGLGGYCLPNHQILIKWGGGGVNHHFLMEKQPSYGVTLITPFHEAILKEDHA